MYEEYSRQALPTKQYRELLGSAISVFNSNNQFVIENILNIDNANFNWYDLIDRTSGRLNEPIKNTITANSNNDIAEIFKNLINKRNRIIHSFQITENNEQILRTKTKNNEQFTISETYLLEFVKDNENLSSMLHELQTQTD